MQLKVSDFCPDLAVNKDFNNKDFSDNKDFSANKDFTSKDFIITGTSYIGRPRSNTAMFITKKVERLLPALNDVTECLVFAEEGINITSELAQRHAFSFSQKPQLEYARFATIFAEERAKQEQKLKFKLITDCGSVSDCGCDCGSDSDCSSNSDGDRSCDCVLGSGYYLCEDSEIGSGCYIEPGCVIGPDVKIGKNARILAGAVIKRSTIGDNVLINEQAVIGANGFTMAEDEDGNKFRIPTLGRVIIGNNVEIGVHNNISCGSGGNTVLEDNVKLDALVHIGHDVHLHKNVEITAGSTISGFVEAGDKVYIGPGSAFKNRISLGAEAFIGVGSCVMKSVEAQSMVAGNPARPTRPIPIQPKQ